jgi:hypothetical protein
VTPPRTSSREQHELFSSLGLAVELHPEGKSEFEAVVSELIAFYADAGRAAEAKVFSLSGRQPPPREVLTQWVGRPLPADAEGDALIGYAADALLIAGDHGASSTAPQLLALEAGDAGLYLLRPHTLRKLMGEHGWVPLTLASPDTEAALSGIYRYEGCTRAFEEHASGCDDCLAALEDWDEDTGLPRGFERFSRPRPVKKQLHDEGIQEEGVAIFIPRPPEPPPKRAPWWKFW